MSRNLFSFLKIFALQILSKFCRWTKCNKKIKLYYMKSLPLRETGRKCLCQLIQIICVGGRSIWNNQRVQRIMGESLKMVEYVCYVVYKLG